MPVGPALLKPASEVEKVSVTMLSALEASSLHSREWPRRGLGWRTLEVFMTERTRRSSLTRTVESLLDEAVVGERGWGISVRLWRRSLRLSARVPGAVAVAAAAAEVETGRCHFCP